MVIECAEAVALVSKGNWPLAAILFCDLCNLFSEGVSASRRSTHLLRQTVSFSRLFSSPGFVGLKKSAREMAGAPTGLSLEEPATSLCNLAALCARESRAGLSFEDPATSLTER